MSFPTICLNQLISGSKLWDSFVLGFLHGNTKRTSIGLKWQHLGDYCCPTIRRLCDTTNVVKLWYRPTISTTHHKTNSFLSATRSPTWTRWNGNILIIFFHLVTCTSPLTSSNTIDHKMTQESVATHNWTKTRTSKSKLLKFAIKRDKDTTTMHLVHKNQLPPESCHESLTQLGNTITHSIRLPDDF